MKKKIQTLISFITFPFSLISILIDESRNINENGEWNTYHSRRNARG